MREFAAQTPPQFRNFFLTYRVPCIFLFASLVCIVASILFYTKTLQTTEPIVFSSDKDISSASQSAKIVVDIRGAVMLPGVYSVPNGSRIADVIAHAGGVSEEVDNDLADKMLNYASFASDGMKIYVPKKENISSEQSQSLSSENVIVSVNTSSSTQLDALPGVGEITVKKIIEHRPYSSLEELVEKQVFSASLLEKLRAQLSL